MKTLQYPCENMQTKYRCKMPFDNLSSQADIFTDSNSTCLYNEIRALIGFGLVAFYCIIVKFEPSPFEHLFLA